MKESVAHRHGDHNKDMYDAVMADRENAGKPKKATKKAAPAKSDDDE